MIEVDGPGQEGLGNVGNAVFVQDVKRETAGTGHDAGVVANATCVLGAGDIADSMVPVLDVPMLADSGGPGGGGEVDGDLAALAEDDPLVGGKGAQHVRRLAVVESVEAAA